MKLKLVNEWKGSKTYKLGKINDDGEGMTKKDLVIGTFVFEPRIKHLVGTSKTKVDKDGKPKSYDFYSIDAVMKGGNLEDVIPDCGADNGYGMQWRLDLGSFERTLVTKDAPEDENGMVITDGFKGNTYVFYMEPFKDREGNTKTMFKMSELKDLTEKQWKVASLVAQDGDEFEYDSTFKTLDDDGKEIEKKIKDYIPYWAVVACKNNMKSKIVELV